MFLVDVGQLFRCAGHHFMCVTMGPPIRGDPISHSQAHIPAPKATVAPKPGPKGQHRQEFRMVYHRKKGFTSQPVEQ